MTKYIRFGEVPEDERSAVYQSGEVVGKEIGVSVWDSVEANGLLFPVMPNNPSESCIHDYFDMLGHNWFAELINPRRVYIVTGDRVGIGSDGEPLIVNVKIEEEITDYMFSYRKGKQ